MKRYFNILSCALCAFALFSCTKENEAPATPEDGTVPPGYTLETLTGVSEQTKTTIDNGVTLWAADDQIKVICSDNSVSNFTIQDGVGTNTGDFQGLVPEGKTAVYAVYPAANYSSVSGSTVKVSIPASQTGVFGAGNLAVAKVDADRNMAFKNVNAFISFTIPAGITKVVISSVDGSDLAGTLSVDCSGDAPAAGAVESGASSVTTTFPDANGGTYYISVAPGVTHTKGLLLTYYKMVENVETESGNYYLNKTILTAANVNIVMGTVEAEGNYYVTVNGAGNKNGMSWENAFSATQMWKKLHLAGTDSETGEPIDAATDEAKLAAIDGATFYMGAGTYDFGSDPTLSFNETDAVTLTFKGGYNPSTGVRNLETNATVITGADAHHCLILSDKMNVTLDGLQFTHGKVNGDSDGALSCSKSSLYVTMTDCIISDNTGEGSNGGGMLAKEKCHIDATRVKFANNTGIVAPALLCLNSYLTFTDCEFEQNHATNWCGAVRVRYNTPSATFTNCRFVNNSAANDSGCFVHSEGTVTLDGCTFTGNTCTGNGGAFTTTGVVTTIIKGGTSFSENEAKLGGAIYTGTAGKATTMTISGNSTFTENHATGWAGAIHFKSPGSLTVTDCTFTGNYGDGDSGAFNADNADATFTFTRVTFSGNHADSDNGGVMWISDGTYIFDNCQFTNNSSPYNGGAIFAQKSAALTIKGGSSFSGNVARLGGAIYTGAESHESPFTSTDTPTLNITEDCTFTGNHATGWAGAIHFKSKGSLTVTDCTFFGNYSAGDSGAFNGDNGSTFKFTRVTFSGNHADSDHGGVMWLQDGTYTFDGCQFLNNYSYSYGGAIYAENNCKLNIDNSTFKGNYGTRASEKCRGGAICLEGKPTLRAFRDSFVDNRSGYGGAIYCIDKSSKYPTVYIDECSFDANYVTYRWGPVFASDGVKDLMINNCSMKNNYTSSTAADDQKNLKPSWVCIDDVTGTACVSNCSIVGDTQYSANGTNFTPLTNNTGLVAVWGSQVNYFTNNIIVPKTSGIAAVISDDSNSKADLYYTYYSKLTGIGRFTNTGGNVANRLSGNIDGLVWTGDNDFCWWKWDGTIAGSAPAMASKATLLTNRLENGIWVDGFKSWLGSDAGKDQRRIDRGSGLWWPGAYQGSALEADLLQAITWNIRSSEMSEDTGDRAWSARRGGMAAFINDRQPQIICMQECESDQRSYLTSNCSGYSAIYDNSSLSFWQQFTGAERSNEVILYKSSDISVQSSGTFWLTSGAPTTPTKSSDQNSYRSCTWMKCTYKGQKMLVMDVHLSYRTRNNSTPQSDEVIALRQVEMGVIKTWIDGHYNPSSDGWLLFMGDMNTSHWEAIFDEWKDGTYGYFSRDNCPGAATGRTYNDWDWENGHVATIDFQFYKGFPSLKSYTIPTATYSDVAYLSDHWPVVVEYYMN